MNTLPELPAEIVKYIFHLREKRCKGYYKNCESHDTEVIDEDAVVMLCEDEVGDTLDMTICGAMFGQMLCTEVDSSLFFLTTKTVRAKGPYCHKCVKNIHLEKKRRSVYWRVMFKYSFD